MVIPTQVFAQKNNIRMQIGIAKRFFPLTLENKSFTTNPRGIYFNSHRQFANYNLSLDISKKIIKQKFDLQISNYLRYGHNHYQRNYVPDGYEEVKKIKSDHFIDMVYNWKLKKSKWKNFSFLIGAGVGLMNVNSGYSFQEAIGTDSAGNPYKIPVHGNFKFSAPRIIIGAQANRFRVFLILHGTPDDNYEPYLTIWPEVKLSYSFLQVKLR